MFENLRAEWRNTPEPALWRAVLFTLVVILALTWPLLRGEPLRVVPAVLASVAALALVVDLARLALARLRR